MPAIVDGTFSLFVQTEVGLTYQLQFVDVLDAPGWSDIAEVLGNGEVMVLSDSEPLAPERFYRVLVRE